MHATWLRHLMQAVPNGAKAKHPVAHILNIHIFSYNFYAIRKHGYLLTISVSVFEMAGMHKNIARRIKFYLATYSIYFLKETKYALLNHIIHIITLPSRL